MRDITIPKTAHIVFGQYWAGWTWITKSYNLKVMRYLYFKEKYRDTYTLVFFSRDDCYEQFKDDLEFMGKDLDDLANGLGDSLPKGSPDHNRSDGGASSDTKAGS